MSEDILVYDIESKTFGLPDGNRDKFKFFGCYSYKTNKYYLLTKPEDIQKVITAHKFLVGFNTEKYDEPILKREGIDFNYKIRIDLSKIIIDRAGAIKIKKGMLRDILMSYSLDSITRMLDLVTDEEAKKKIDYKIFNKDSWTTDELNIIKEYTLRDVEVTKKLYEWIEDYFSAFKDFLWATDVEKKKYLTVSIAKFAYKAVCKEMKWEEKYDTNAPEDEDKIDGGYVSFPSGEEFHNDIYALDYGSEYPHAMMMANLYGRKKSNELNDRPIWTGGGVWKVSGVYYADDMHPVGKLIKKWFGDRLAYKKAGDKREYTIKIILNTLYGILDNPYYIRVYDKVAAADCTSLGRQWIKYARKVFRDKGYTILYTDTDSLYIQDPFKDKDKVVKIKQEIIEYIKSTVAFPQETFTLVLENEIEHMFFFKGNKIEEADDEMEQDDFINRMKGLMKKNYIYVTKEKDVIIKNLGIRKKSNTPLSKKIFWEYLVPKIKDGQIKFSKTYIKNLINELLQKDISLMTLRKDVDTYESYAKSKTSLPAQIALKYGSGIWFLIPNIKNLGVGKGKSYCTVEEFNKHNLKYTDIDLSNVWNELEYFIKEPPKVNIFSFGEEK